MQRIDSTAVRSWIWWQLQKEFWKAQNKHCECIQEEVAVTKSQHGASYSKSHYSEIISFMTEFTFWKISEVSFSSIKYWLFSRILYSALSRVANLVRCKPRASKKKYLEKVCLGVKKTQRKTELSNEDRVQTIFEPLGLQPYLWLFHC